MKALPRAAGQAMTEFLIALPLLILLLFGLVQFALIYQARATLNHAAMLAARAGALHNGDRGEMRQALADGLAPLFASEASAAGYAQAVLKARVETAALANMAALDVLNPTRAAITDFGRARLDGTGGRELPNDTLNYRSTAPGGASRISVQDANLLHLRVTYCFRLIVPVVDRVIHAAANALTPLDPALSANGMSDPFGTGGTTVPRPACFNPAFRGPRIEIRSEAFVRMQSPFYESNL
ncbi:TadE/TadG family type IV pilus assembly protein [Massilia consociata]|uniref:TadE/TadG family type IV pilus assembly protein n=1 Tax=Massilia consociata TaxID=760117 RepID=A0ABV6FKR6_9BURK